MPFSAEIIDELNLLLKFDQSSLQQGIKVHHDASPAHVAAAKRLFEKGLCSRDDGGYLTDLGREVIAHLEKIHNVMHSTAQLQGS